MQFSTTQDPTLSVPRLLYLYAIVYATSHGFSGSGTLADLS